MSRPLFITDEAFRVPRDGHDGLPGRDGRDGRPGSDGRDGQGFNWRGSWSRRVSDYAVNDVVGHDGSAYLCVEAGTRHEPPNRGWQLLAQRGQRGPRGERGNAPVLEGPWPGAGRFASLEERLEALEAGGTGGSELVPLIFDVETSKGMVVCATTDGHCGLADASSNPTAIGLCQSDNVVAGAAGLVNPDGVIELDDWSAVVSAEHLTPGVVYYLASVPGKMTSVAPVSGFVSVIGRAASSTVFSIEIAESIKL